MVKVVIDRDGCISCGACWTSCPEFFQENMEDNRSSVIEKYREGKLGEGEAPPELEDCIKGAAEQCPVQVIHAHP